MVTQLIEGAARLDSTRKPARVRATGPGTRPTLDVEGAVVEQQAILVAYGRATRSSLPQLDAALQALVARQPIRLTVDLSETSEVDVAVLEVITQRGYAVPQFLLRLPDGEKMGR